MVKIWIQKIFFCHLLYHNNILWRTPPFFKINGHTIILQTKYVRAHYYIYFTKTRYIITYLFYNLHTDYATYCHIFVDFFPELIFFHLASVASMYYCFVTTSKQPENFPKSGIITRSSSFLSALKKNKGE